MRKIDPKEYQKRLERMNELLAGIAAHADELSRTRCPYKDRFNRCTARFGCRNQGKASLLGELPVCLGDERLDYRGAWET
jgi:hypothetical protein